MRTLLLLTALVLSGCSSPAPPQAVAPTPAIPESGDTLVVAVPADVSGFNPLVPRGPTDLDVMQHMFPLLASARFDCRLQFGPGLAESWEFSEDGKSLTLRLSDALSWQDGEAVDADDLLFSWQLAANPETASVAGRGLVRLDPERGPERVDAHTVVVHFRDAADPTTLLAELVRVFVVPEHILRDVEPAELRGADFSGAPVASGPFVLERWAEGSEITLARRSDSPSGAYLDRVVLRVMGDAAARELAFETGEVDMIAGPDLASLSRIRDGRPDAQALRRGYRFLDVIAWNLTDARFSDAPVRQALAHAIDVDAIIANQLTVGSDVYGKRATGTLTPELCGIVDGSIPPVPHDPDRARSLLAEAGWTDTDGDGVVDRDGAALSFTLVYSQGSSRRADVAVILQQQLAAVGVAVQPMSMESLALNQRLRERDFEAALVGWSAGLVVDPEPQWHSGDRGRYNLTSYENPAVDTLIQQGKAALTPEQAEPIWREMLALIHADQPVCFLYWVDEVVLLDGRFRDATASTQSLLHDLHEWWVPKVSQKRDTAPAEAPSPPTPVLAGEPDPATPPASPLPGPPRVR